MGGTKREDWGPRQDGGEDRREGSHKNSLPLTNAGIDSGILTVSYVTASPCPETLDCYQTGCEVGLTDHNGQHIGGRGSGNPWVHRPRTPDTDIST